MERFSKAWHRVRLGGEEEKLENCVLCLGLLEGSRSPGEAQLAGASQGQCPCPEVGLERSAGEAGVRGYGLLAKSPLSLTGGCSRGDEEGGLVTSQVEGGVALGNYSGTGLRKSTALGLDMALALPSRAEAQHFNTLSPTTKGRREK